MPDTGDTPFVNSIRAHIPLNKGVGANVWRYANNSLVLKAGGGYWLRY